MSYNCKICGNFFSEHLSFFSHLKKCHNLSGQAYYDAYMKKSGEGVCEYCKKPTKYYGLGKGYARFCCTTCSNTVLAAETKSYELKCEVCDETICGIGLANATKALVNHLKKEHNIYDTKIYYDTYLKKSDDEGICPCCKGETEFKSINTGYAKYCSISCEQQHLKSVEDSYSNKVHFITKLKNSITEMTTKIVDKYQNFFKNEKLAKFGDIRTDAITHKTVAQTKQAVDLDGNKIEIKTEISSSTARDYYTGSRQQFRVREEGCNADYDFDEIIESGEEINSNEWC